MREEKSSEKYIENKLCEELKKLDILTLKFVSPGRNGVPDRIAIGHFGNFYFVELKRPKGSRTAALQRYWSRVLSARFIKNFLIKNEEDLKAFIKEVKEDETNYKPVNQIGFWR